MTRAQVCWRLYGLRRCRPVPQRGHRRRPAAVAGIATSLQIGHECTGRSPMNAGVSPVVKGPSARAGRQSVPAAGTRAYPRSGRPERQRAPGQRDEGEQGGPRNDDSGIRELHHGYQNPQHEHIRHPPGVQDSRIAEEGRESTPDKNHPERDQHTQEQHQSHPRVPGCRSRKPPGPGPTCPAGIGPRPR